MFRCSQCGAVLSSMWRLRQHLADHSRTQQTVAEGKGDHVYGRSSRRLQNTVKIKEKGDHGYAGSKKVDKELTKRQNKTSVTFSPNKIEHYTEQNEEKRMYLESKRKHKTKGSETTNTLTPPGSR